jgi:hypothetical protein
MKFLQELTALSAAVYESIKDLALSPDQERALGRLIGDHLSDGTQQEFNVEVHHVQDEGDCYKAFYTFEDPKTGKDRHGSIYFKARILDHSVEDFEEKSFNEGLTSESRSFREEPIPPFAVCYSYDGVVHKDDVFMGSRAECLKYMRTHKAKKPFTFDLMDTDSGRLVSYSLKESKVNDDAYYIVEPDGNANRKSRNYVDLYTEKSFSSIEAANRYIEREISELDNTDEGDEAADLLRDCTVMSGASLKRQYPKLFEAGRTFTIKNDAIKPRGAPEVKARAFDPVDSKTGERPSRATLDSTGKVKGSGKYVGLEFADEIDFITVHVIRDDMEINYSQRRDPNDRYEGIHVLFFPDGKINADTYDLTSKRQWVNDKEKIIKAAKDALRDENLSGQYDGLMGRSVKRGKSKLSFDVDNHKLDPDPKMNRHQTDESLNESFARAESMLRDKMISRVEGFFGDLQSLRYDQLNTEDLAKIFFTLVEKNLVKSVIIAGFGEVAKAEDLERFLGA